MGSIMALRVILRFSTTLDEMDALIDVLHEALTDLK